MIISDGTTTLTFIDAGGNPDSEIISSERITASGRIKSQSSGERYSEMVNIRLTGAEYRQLLDLLKNGATEYYYTPSSIPPEYSASDFPMTVRIDNIRKYQKAHDGAGIVYYVHLDIKSSNLL